MMLEVCQVVLEVQLLSAPCQGEGWVFWVEPREQQALMVWDLEPLCHLNRTEIRMGQLQKGVVFLF